MNILAFDTSLKKCSVSLLHKDIKTLSMRSNQSNMHSEALHNLVEQTLSYVNINYQDISHIAFTRGPGSFTGIRVSLAFARAILCAMPNVIPITFTTLEMLYFRAKTQIKNITNICIIMNAYGKEYYVQLLSQKQKSNIKVMTLQQIENFLSEFDKSDIVCATSINDDDEIINLITKKLGIFFLPRFASSKDLIPEAVTQIKLNKIKSNLTPLYIKPASTN